MTMHSSSSSSVAARSTPQVLNSHLGAFAQGLDVILADYAEASVLITPERVYRGLLEISGFFRAFLGGATPAFWASFQRICESAPPIVCRARTSGVATTCTASPCGDRRSCATSCQTCSGVR